MKTRIYAAPAVKGLNQHWVDVLCFLGYAIFMSEHGKYNYVKVRLVCNCMVILITIIYKNIRAVTF